MGFLLDMRAAIIVLILLAACPGEPSMEADMGPDLSFSAYSECGRPGDVGNSLGVGRFCRKLSDCSENSGANLCTQLGDPNNYFCTMPCKKDGASDQCGENARCACDSDGRGCGCYPTACDSPTK